MLRAIRQGKTVVFDESGAAYGDPELIRLLEKNGVHPANPRGSVSISGPLAWTGLLGWLLLGRSQD